MTLEHKVAQLIGQWQGLDANERTDRRGELVDALIALIRTEPAAPAIEPATAAASATSPRAA